MSVSEQVLEVVGRSLAGGFFITAESGIRDSYSLSELGPGPHRKSLGIYYTGWSPLVDPWTGRLFHVSLSGLSVVFPGGRAAAVEADKPRRLIQLTPSRVLLAQTRWGRSLAALPLGGGQPAILVSLAAEDQGTIVGGDEEGNTVVSSREGLSIRRHDGVTAVLCAGKEGQDDGGIIFAHRRAYVHAYVHGKTGVPRPPRSEDRAVVIYDLETGAQEALSMEGWKRLVYDPFYNEVLVVRWSGADCLLSASFWEELGRLHAETGQPPQLVGELQRHDAERLRIEFRVIGSPRPTAETLRRAALGLQRSAAECFYRPSSGRFPGGTGYLRARENFFRREPKGASAPGQSAEVGPSVCC